MSLLVSLLAVALFAPLVGLQPGNVPGVPAGRRICDFPIVALGASALVEPVRNGISCSTAIVRGTWTLYAAWVTFLVL